MTKKKYIKIVQAIYLTDYTVKLIFNDGTAREIDFGVFLKNHSHPQWNKYTELNNFKTFHIDETGNIVWGKNLDLMFPLGELYEGLTPA
jgi:hypothetical protein